MRGPLQGRSILVVEDEPLIAMDIAKTFESTGAEMTTTNTLRHALLLVEHDGLSSAILDHALGDGDSSLLCARLKQRGIPFLIYSAFEKLEGEAKGAPHISKPASPEALVAAMEDLLRAHDCRRRTDCVSENLICPACLLELGVERRADEVVLTYSFKNWEQHYHCRAEGDPVLCGNVLPTILRMLPAAKTTPFPSATCDE